MRVGIVRYPSSGKDDYVLEVADVEGTVFECEHFRIFTKLTGHQVGSEGKCLHQ